MSEEFNLLTPAEAERLAMLAEECGEVIQIIGKILRHGYKSFHPDAPNGPRNREMLMQELGDVNAILDRMEEAGDIQREPVLRYRLEKYHKLPRYAHHQAWNTRAGEKA